MKVIDHEPHAWFLLQDADVLLLDVACSHGVLGYSFTMALDQDEHQRYEAEGHSYVRRLAAAVNYSAPVFLRSNSPYKELNIVRAREKEVLEAVLAWRDQSKCRQMGEGS